MGGKSNAMSAIRVVQGVAFSKLKLSIADGLLHFPNMGSEGYRLTSYTSMRS